MWPLKGESTTSVGAGSQGEEQSYNLSTTSAWEER
jgi:hypothetical protein